MASDGSDPEHLRLSETEARVLQLYDSLQHLQFELALLRAQQSITSHSDAGNATPDHLLEAKALLSLRNSVIEGVVMVQPLLEAVHHGKQASPVERDLAPRVEQRDVTATRAAKHSSDLNQVTDQLVKVQAEVQVLTTRNTMLASNVLQLAEENQTRHRVEDVESTQLKKEMAEAEKGLVTSRQRWKAIKGVTSAVVAGSGVDWVRDSRLRDMVLDPPD